MSLKGPSPRQPLITSSRRRGTRAVPNQPLQKSELWIELIRQQARLLISSNAFLRPDREPETCSDLIDQASTELEQELILQVKIRTIAKIRAIESALQLMRMSHYGLCRHCHENIPYERLKVQPDALFCVPCLAIIEQRASEN